VQFTPLPEESGTEEHPMRNLKLALEVDNRASAIVTGTGNAVKLEVDPELMWDREGLLKLSAALTSIAGMLPE